MLYATIEAMLSTTDNMTVIRNNSRNDDGTDTLTGANWFTFKGVVARSVYVNGNGWVNFGSSSEGGLKVNRRDQASYYVWREEGSIRREENRFLRIRWRGYSQYNVVSDDRLLDFDVVLLSTGDIILRITTWPTVYADGVNRLEATANVVYVPGQDAKEFTFIHQDATGNRFIVQSGIEEVFAPRYYLQFVANGGYGNMPRQSVLCGVETAIQANKYNLLHHTFLGWDTAEESQTVVYADGEEITDIAEEEETVTLYAVWRRSMGWLFRDGEGNFFTATQEGGEQTRVPITGTPALNAETFYTLGFQFTPESGLFEDLDAPTIYKWDKDQVPELTAEVTAIPVVPQLVVFNTATLKAAIKYVNIIGDSESLWNVSFDNGLTWYKYQGSWIRATGQGDGCVKRQLEVLTADRWAAMAGSTLKFRCWLYARGWVKSIRIDY